MNRQEFEEARMQFAEILYSYEHFLKECYLADARYNYLFFPSLKLNHFYEVENMVLENAINYKDKASAEQIKVGLKDAQEKYSADYKNAFKKNYYCNQLIPIIDKNGHERDQELEDLFHDFIVNKHPLVRLNGEPKVKPVVDYLLRCYYENNIGGFLSILDTHKNAFLVQEPEEKDFTAINKIYFDNKSRINTAYANQRNSYPAVKIDIFKDEMTIQAEKDDIDIRRNNLILKNKSLHDEFKKAYGFEFKLEMPNVTIEDLRKEEEMQQKEKEAKEKAEESKKEDNKEEK